MASRRFTLAAIALGSNLGDSLTLVTQAVEQLQQYPGLTVLRQSAWYKTAPVGPPQPDYVNGCIVLGIEVGASGKPIFTPHQLLSLLLKIELQFGRERRERWGARTLDLDLLLVEGMVLHTPELELPHPRLRERAFVLVPLAEILPDWQDPISGLTVRQLCNRVDPTGVVRL